MANITRFNPFGDLTRFDPFPDMNDWFNRFSFDVISIMNDLMGNRLQERLLLGRILGR